MSSSKLSVVGSAAIGAWTLFKPIVLGVILNVFCRDVEAVLVAFMALYDLRSFILGFYYPS